MAEVTRVYKQSMPALKLVGRYYREDEKVNGTFANIWGEWFAKNLFEPLKLPECGSEPFEDCNAYIGMCRCKEGEPFVYWIGVFMPVDAPVPDGYESIEFPAGDIGVCWIRGKEPDVYMHCCLDDLKKAGFEWATDKEGVRWCFERYVYPRFTNPDAEGNVTLDMCFYI